MGKDGQTSSQSSEPWEPQQEFLLDLWNQAQSLSQNPLQRYSGNRIGGLSANTTEASQAGLGMIRGAGQGQGGQYIQDVLGGQYLSPDSNPYLRQMADQGAADITRQFRTAVAPGISMAGIGRSGSGAELNRAGQAYRGLGDALASNYANTYGRSYQMERGFQQQAPGMLSQYDANTRANVGFGAAMGQPMERQEQRRLDENVQAFDFRQNEPGRRLDQYQNRIFGGGVIPGTTTTTMSGGGPNQTMQGLGIAASLIGAFCSRGWKDELHTIDPVKALQALETLEIPIWRYTEEFQAHQAENGRPVDNAQHIGPYAEDFAALLGLGDGKSIAFIDIVGLALAASKGAAIQFKEMSELVVGLLDRINKLEGVVGKPFSLKVVPD